MINLTNLVFYALASAVYIMTIHFGLAIKNQFNVWLMTGFFILGAAVGWYLNSLEAGFIVAVVLSLIFW